MYIGILAGPLLTADRMLQFGRLCPTYERAKDDGRLIFSFTLEWNQTISSTELAQNLKE